MKLLHLLPIGNVDDGLLQELASRHGRNFSRLLQGAPTRLDPEFAFHGERQQYHSSEILHRMQSFSHRRFLANAGSGCGRSLHPDSYFVFGEAQMGGPCAVVSAHRLRQEFYGLPADLELYRQRVIKEAVHEVGHTLSLTHCEDYSCAMAPSHAVEWIDLKEGTLCSGCRAAAAPMPQTASPRWF
jgi:archaemetzincin